MPKQQSSQGGTLHSPNLETQPILLSVQQAAFLAGIGTTFAWELIRTGTLPSIRLGRRVLVPRTSLEKLAQNGIVQPAETGQ